MTVALGRPVVHFLLICLLSSMLLGSDAPSSLSKTFDRIALQ